MRVTGTLWERLAVGRAVASARSTRCSRARRSRVDDTISGLAAGHSGHAHPPACVPPAPSAPGALGAKIFLGGKIKNPPVFFVCTHEPSCKFLFFSRSDEKAGPEVVRVVRWATQSVARRRMQGIETRSNGERKEREGADGARTRVQGTSSTTEVTLPSELPRLVALPKTKQ